MRFTNISDLILVFTGALIISAYSSSLLALKSNLHRLQFILKFNNIHPFARHFINRYSIAIDKITTPIFCYRSFQDLVPVCISSTTRINNLFLFLFYFSYLIFPQYFIHLINCPDYIIRTMPTPMSFRNRS